MSFKALEIDQGGTGGKTANEAKTNLSLNNVDNTSDATKNSATATLTNKTLTSPVVNVTSDATGDIYYRNAGGLFTRLPIGTVGQVITQTGGIPAWETPAGGGVSEIFNATTNLFTGLTTSATVVIFSAEQIDTGSNFNTTTGKYTAPSSGDYSFNISMSLFGLTALDEIQTGIYLNGTIISALGNSRLNGTAGNNLVSKTFIVSLSTSDTIEVRIANVTAARGNINTSIFSGFKL